MKQSERELIELYLQDDCSEEQLARILELVATDEKFRKELAESGRLQGLLAAANCDDYDSIAQRVERNIDNMEESSFEDEIFKKIDEPVQRSSQKWSISLWVALAAQIVIFFFLFNESANHKFEPETLASLYSENGNAWLIRKGKKIPVSADLRLIGGDEILVEEKGDLRITWNDSTVTQFEDHSEAVFTLDQGAKHIFFRRGNLQALVTRQPEGKPLLINTPNSEVKVLGTKFHLKVNELQTMLEVQRGAVHLTKRSTGESTTVKAHEYALSSPTESLNVYNSKRAIYRSPEVNLDTPDLKVDIMAEINGVRKLYLVVHCSKDSMAFDHAAWLNPRLEDFSGRELSLIKLKWKFADCGWGKTFIGRSPTGKKLKYNKKALPKGYWYSCYLDH